MRENTNFLRLLRCLPEIWSNETWDLDKHIKQVSFPSVSSCGCVVTPSAYPHPRLQVSLAYLLFYVLTVPNFWTPWTSHGFMLGVSSTSIVFSCSVFLRRFFFSCPFLLLKPINPLRLSLALTFAVHSGNLSPLILLRPVLFSASVIALRI